MKIGFVGVGAMGVRMAQRLLDAGHSLQVHNRNEARAQPLVDAGARWAATPADAARGAELVFSMLTDDAAVEAMTLGADGIAEGLAEGAVHLSSSTISVALSARLAAAHAERRQGYLSATVMGRPPAAAAGELFIILAGDPVLQERATPALQAVGQRIFDVGDDPTRGNLVKLSVNFLILSTVEQMSEIFAINEKAGLAPADMLEILTGSFFNAPVHRNYGRLIVERAFDPPGASMMLAAKDIGLFLEAGSGLEVPLPMASLLRDRVLTSFARGEGGLDFAALSRRARQDAGLPD